MLLLKGHGYRSSVRSIAFSPDGRFLASASTDDTVRLWDLSTGEDTVVSREYFVHSVDFAPDGKTLALSFPRDIVLLDIASGRSSGPGLTGEYDGARRVVRYSPDGRFLGAVGRTVRLWEAATGRPLPVAHETTPATGCLAFSPDGRCLAVGHTLKAPGRGRDTHFVDLRDQATGAEWRAIHGPTDAPTALAFSPDSRRLAAACGQHLWVWDVQTGEALLSRRTDVRHYKGVAFSPDGRLLAAAHNDEVVRFLDTEAWSERAAFDWKIGPVVDVAFARDGMRAAASSAKGRIVVWDVDL